MRPLLRDDARLLDSVAHYLSVQLAAAFTALRTQRADRLASLETQMRGLLNLGSTDMGDKDLAAEKFFSVAADAAEELEASLIRMKVGGSPRVVVADLPLTGTRDLPIDLDALVRPVSHDGVAVVPIVPDSEALLAAARVGRAVPRCAHGPGKACGRATLPHAAQTRWCRAV